MKSVIGFIFKSQMMILEFTMMCIALKNKIWK